MAASTDYGVNLDRRWAAVHIAVTITILATIRGRWPLLTLALYSGGIGLVLTKAWMILNADQPRAHAVAVGVAVTFFPVVAVLIAAGLAHVPPVVAAAATAGLASDAWIYHTAALRRIAFFRARRKAGR